MIEFFIPLARIPSCTAQQKRFTKTAAGKVIAYDPPELQEVRALFTAHLAPHAPERPLQGPVRLVVIWWYPTEGVNEIGKHKSTRPDLDNLQKAFQDSMGKCRFWKDDAQVASLIVEKRYGDPSGILVQVNKAE